MLKVSDRFFIAVIMDNKEIPLDKLGFNSFQAHSNVNFFQPMGKLTLLDNYNYFESNPVGDNVVVDVFTGTNNDRSKAKRYSFRLFKKLTNRHGSAKAYDFLLSFNAPRYFNENSTTAIDGTAATAIQTIATESKITRTDIDKTSDRMVWLPMGAKRCQFARDITQYAYANDQSCFGLGITLDGRLRFKNISAIDLSKATTLFVKGTSSKSENILKALADKEIMKSGFQNNLTGYKYETLEQTTGDAVSHSKVSVPTTSKTLLINKDMNAKLSGSRIHVTPVASSNAHPNYYKALHQNTRIKNTYSLAIQLVTNSLTDLDIFDPIKYLAMETVPGGVQPNKAMSGAYLITAKTVYATSDGMYYEKYELHRQGYNFNTISQSQISAASGV